MKITKLLLLFVFAALVVSCTAKKEVFNQVIKSEWQFRKAGDTVWYSATVPGCVHTDLLNHKLIPDPSFRKNELEVKWVENTDWEYATNFNVDTEISDFTHINLEFLGLDTYADVYLNDSLLFSADNMFISWDIPVKNHIKKGSNNLHVYFHSAVAKGMEKLRKKNYLHMAANEIAPEAERSNVFTRKAPFHYGWDWGPRLVTCGLWKPIVIHAWNSVKMSNIYLKPVSISTQQAVYTAMIEVDADRVENKTFEVWIDNKKAASVNDTRLNAGKNEVAVQFNIDKPEFWWTNGLGAQKLYSVEVRMCDKSDVNQKLNTRIGVRTLELVQEKDSIGTSFYFKINGVPVFMKGANYIPSDIFVTRNTLLNYERVVDDAIKANMNMLRIWGGAIYENNELYDLFDEKGILAWNDFMFACSMQPNDSSHIENIRREAEYNVRRLRNHPSIALWCGNNENLRAWNEWGWKNQVTKEQGDELWSAYEKIFYNVLPNAVRQFNPEVSYWASSPQAAGNLVTDRISGEEHDWSVWFGNMPFTSYAWKIPRFVSEYGLQSFPEIKTIAAFTNDSDQSYRSPVMEHRQRSNMPWMGANFNGNEMIKTYMARYYKVPNTFGSFVYVSQLLQAEGIKSAIESHRGNMHRCMGSLYWQINDCWPTMSWASVDYFGRWKALHYTVKNAFQRIYPIITTQSSNLDIKVVSDHLQPVKATIVVSLLDFDGKVLWQKNVDTTIAPNASFSYFSINKTNLLNNADTSKCLLDVEVVSNNTLLANNHYYFTEFKNLMLKTPTLKTKVKQLSDNTYEIAISANTLVKNLAFSTTQSESFFSDNYFDVLPGKEYKIICTVSSADFEAELKYMSLNQAYNN